MIISPKVKNDIKNEIRKEALNKLMMGRCCSCPPKEPFVSGVVTATSAPNKK